MWDGGRGSRYAMLSRHLVLPWAENHMKMARSPGFWVAAIGELGQLPTWTPAVSAPITRWAASPSRSLTGSKTGSANPSPGASNKSPSTSSLCDGSRPEPGDHRSVPCVIVIAAIQGVCRLRWSNGCLPLRRAEPSRRPRLRTWPRFGFDCGTGRGEPIRLYQPRCGTGDLRPGVSSPTPPTCWRPTARSYRS